MTHVRFLLLALIALLLSSALGCVSTEAVADDDASPTGTPDPTPTAPPTDDYYRITELIIADSTTSCGSKQCSAELEAMLDYINQTIYDQVALAVCWTGPCTTSEAAIMAQVGILLDTILNVETLSAAVNNPIQSGKINLLMEIKELKVGGDAYTLSFCTGTPEGSGLGLDSCSAPDPGTLDSDGNLTFGPTTLPLTFTMTDSKGNEVFSYALELDVISVSIPGYSTPHSYVLIAGALSEADIIGLTNQVIDAVNKILVNATLDPISKEEVDAQIEAGLAPYMDVQTEEGDAMEIDLIGQWEMINIVQ